MEKQYKLANLEKLSQDDLFGFVNGISEEQALDSDVGGYSDAINLLMRLWLHMKQEHQHQ